MFYSRASALVITVALVPTFPTSAQGQEGLPIGGDGVSVRLELLKPSIEEDGRFPGSAAFGLATSMISVDVAIPAPLGTTVFVNAGFFYANRLDEYAHRLRSPYNATISNPRIGVLFKGPGIFEGHVHVDLPLAKEIGLAYYSSAAARLTDTERRERFDPNGWSVGGSVTPKLLWPSGAFIGVRLGTTIWIPTVDWAERYRYSRFAVLIAHVPVGPLRVGGGFSGVATIGTPFLLHPLDPTDTWLYLWRLSVGLPHVALAPEVFVRIPADDDLEREGFGTAVGVRVRFGG